MQQYEIRSKVIIYEYRHFDATIDEKVKIYTKILYQFLAIFEIKTLGHTN